METLTLPQLSTLGIGKEYKILTVTGVEGSMMPLHLSTREAVIIVIRGKAVLSISNKEIHLKPNHVSIIPAMQSHSILIQEYFEAYVIMADDSEIKFINN